MSMDAQDWADLGTVYRAGADRARGWEFNAAMQIQARVLEYQAEQCDVIARERAGWPAVDHDDEHYHERAGRRILHRHPHHRPADVSHHGHDHERDPFAPPESLAPLWDGRPGQETRL